MKTCTICSNTLQGQQQKFCSNKCKQKSHYNSVKRQTNTYHSQTIRALRRKIKLIEIVGGGCKHCGYAANISALHFHHIDASEKSFKLGARILSNRSWDAILQEAQKCKLLCANCHSEIHNSELMFDNAIRILED